MRMKTISLLMMFAAALFAQGQTLDESWTLTVHGQTARANPDGSFRITNIAAPDLFGPGGPGTAPDFLSDDFVRLTGYRTENGGETLYVFSDPFQITQGTTFRVGGLTFTETPPPQPVSIAVSAPTMVIEVGDTLQLTVTGDMADGSTQDLTARTAWTIYRTSNADVASVGRDGLVTANDLGLVFITVVNEGAVAIKSVSVTTKVLTTTVEGFVQLDGESVAGATVGTTLGDSTTTDADGFFSMVVDVSSEEGLSLFVTAQVGGEPYRGLSESLVVMPGGITDGGLIALIPGGDDDGDGIPNDQEEAVGLNPNNPDSDGNGIPDGREDNDGDGLTNGFEVLAGLDIGDNDSDDNGILDGLEDPDGDGLTNLQELAAGTDPFSADSDGDGMSDGFEVMFGLNPNNLSDVNQDPDNDGLTNLEESLIGTDPFNPDVTAPAAESATPGSGAADVLVNSYVLARFNEPIRLDTVITSNVRLFPTALIGSDIVGTVHLSVDGRSVVFRPESPLNASTGYTLHIENLRDLAGNLLPAPFETSFTTGTGEDDVRPTVTLTNPVSGSGDVPLNAPITVIYDEDMDPASFSDATFIVRDTFTGVILEGSLFVNDDNRTVRFVPAQNFGAGRSISVAYGNVTDLSGNRLSGSSNISFTTGLIDDLLEPVLIGVSPFDGLTNVPINAFIMIDFNLPVFLPLPEGAIEITTGGVPVDGAMTFDNGNSRVLFTPATTLSPNTTYTVAVTALLVDVVGTPLNNPDTISFTTGSTEDDTGPTLVYQSPPSNSRGISRLPTISIQYSEPLNLLTATSSNVRLTVGGSSLQTPVDFSFSTDGTTIYMTPRGPLLAGTQYRYIASGLQDLVGETAQFVSALMVVGETQDQTAPSVARVSPLHGSTGVALNSRVSFQFDEPVDPTQTAMPVVLTNAGLVGDTVDGTVSWSSDFQIVTFSPSTANPAGELSPNTTYTVTVGEVVDPSGNPVNAFSSSFTTGTVSDDVRPSVVSIEPASGETGVDVGEPIVVTYDEPIDPTSIHDDSMVVTVSGFGGEVAGSFSVSGSVVTFTPLPEDLLVPPNGARVNIALNTGVRDLAGNQANFFTSHYFTGGVAETSNPRVLSMSPAAGTANVGLNQEVILEISESLDSTTVNQTSFNLVNTDGPLGGVSISRSDDNRFITLRANLPADEAVTVVVTEDAVDLSGNPMIPFAGTFFTGPALDTTQPRVSSQRPTNAATDVDPDLPVVLFMTKPMDPASLVDHFVVTQNGNIVSGHIVVNGGGLVLQFEPDTSFSANASIQVFLDDGAKDTAGNTVIAYAGRFTTAGNPADEAPVLVDISGAFAGAPANTVIEIRYNERLDPASVNSGTVTFSAPASVSLVGTGDTIRIVPLDDLETVSHSVRILGNTVFDRQGDPVPALFRSFLPSAERDESAPAVVSVSPPTGLSGVSVNSRLNFRFSEAISPTSVSESSVMLNLNGAIDDSLNFSFSSDNLNLVVVPHRPLAENANVLVTLNGIRDFAGNPLPLFTSTFSTSDELDTVRPTVVDSSPSANAINVPTSTQLLFRLSEAIDFGSITESSFRVQDRITNEDLTGQVVLSADARTLQLVPDVPLAASRDYLMAIASPITDLAGNAVTNRTILFTTGAAGDGLGPTVVQASPAESSENAPLNPLIHVEFSEPVLGSSLNQVFLFATGDFGSTLVPIETTLTNDNTRLEVRPVSALSLNQTYQLSVSGVRDRSGMPLSETFTRSFMTGRGYDLIRPFVLYTDPISNSLFLPTNTRVTALFSEAIDPITLDLLAFEKEPSGAPVPATVTLSADRTVVMVTPNQPLVLGQDYSISLSNVLDVAGLVQSPNVFHRFTVSEGADTEAPLLTAVSPPQEADSAPLNSRFRLLFNEPIAAALGGEVMLTPDLGTPIAGELSYSIDRRLVTFSPSVALASAGQYTFAVSGFTDLSGNVMSAYQDTFTISAAEDEVRPTLTGNSPENNDTEVPINTPVTLTFSETVDPTTVDPNTIRITAGGQTVAGDFSVADNVVIFTPLVTETLFPGGVQITVLASGVSDLAGNTLVGTTFRYDTVGPAETVRPMVSSVVPSDGAVDVPLSPIVLITFSEPMDVDTLNGNSINLIRDGQTLNLGMTVADDGTQVYFSPNLGEAETIQVAVTSAALDLNGNACIPFSSTFSTQISAEDQVPRVEAQFPALSSEDVDPAVSIALVTNEPVDLSTLEQALIVTENGVVVQGSLTLSGNNTIIEFDPATHFELGSRVDVTLDSAMSTTGFPITRYEGHFTVRLPFDEVTPRVLLYSGAVNGGPLNPVFEFLFNEPIDPASVTADTVRLLQNGQAQSATLSLDDENTVVRLTPAKGLLASTVYSVSLNGVTDTDGVLMTPFGRAFTTGDAEDDTAPMVTVASPGDGFAALPRNVQIHLVLSEPLGQGSLSRANVSLNAGADDVPLILSDFSDAELTINAQEVLGANTEYTLTINGLRDHAGHDLVHSQSFSTGGTVDLERPGYQFRVPDTNETGVPPNIIPRVDFTERLDRGLGSLVTLTENGVGLVSGTAAFGSDGTYLTFTPDTVLNAETVYSFRYTGMLDLAGNSIVGNTLLTFTTGSENDSTPPEVLLVSPPSGVTNTPLNTLVSIRFSEPVQPSSLAGVTLVASGLTRAELTSSPAVTMNLSDSNTRLDLIPTGLLAANTGYTLSMTGVLDRAGNTIADTNFSFTTGDEVDLVRSSVIYSSPVTLSSDLPLDTQVAVLFSERINPVSLDDLVISQNGTPVEASLQLDPSLQAVIMTPNQPLAADSSTIFSISNYEDLSGRVGVNHSRFFNTGSTATDTQAPAVQSTSPQDGAVNVPLNTNIRLLFDEPIAADGLVPGKVTLRANNQDVEAEVTVDSTMTLVDISPALDLTADTTYSIGAVDQFDWSGNQASSFSAGFTTGTETDSDGLTVDSVSPAVDATGVSVSSSIVLTFSEMVDATTVNSTGIAVTIDGTTTRIDGSFTVNGAVVTFTPDVAMPAGTTIDVRVNGNPKDLAGHNPTFFNSHFTTAN